MITVALKRFSTRRQHCDSRDLEIRAYAPAIPKHVLAHTMVICLGDGHPARRRQTYGYLPSRRTSLPCHWYQLYCLVTGYGGTCVSNLP